MSLGALLASSRSVGRRWFRAIPFVGRLIDCSRRDLKEAATEVIVATAFSTMPLWLLPVLSTPFFRSPVTGYEPIKTGELFLFSAALVGPLIYIITKNYAERTGRTERGFLDFSIRFPHGASFIYACIAICLLSSFAFYVLRNPLLQDTKFLGLINYDGVVTASWITFAFATGVYFCATAFRNSLEDIGGRLKSDEIDFLRKWEEEA